MNTETEAIRAALALSRLEGAREVLRLIVSERAADVRQAGTAAHLLAFLLGASPCSTQTALAKRLGVTRARISQMLRTLNRIRGNSGG